MTLTDIARMLKLAKVPRSIVTERLYPNPWISIEVPAENAQVILGVVLRMSLPSQRVTVTPLDPSHALGRNEHKYFKIKGEITAPARPYTDATMPEPYYRLHRMKTARRRNADVVIDYASVAL
jgi:hypothetical protein